MAIADAPRFVVLIAYEDGWGIEEETDDHTAAVVSVRQWQDVGKTVRLVDTQEEF